MIMQTIQWGKSSDAFAFELRKPLSHASDDHKDLYVSRDSVMSRITCRYVTNNLFNEFAVNSKFAYNTYLSQ